MAHPHHLVRTLVALLSVVATALAFLVAAAPAQAASAELSAVSLNRTAFYPTVVDGYKDTVTLRYTVSLPAHVEFDVINKYGTTTRHFEREVSEGSHTWTWDGHKNDGSTAALGDFTVRVRATGEDGITRGAHQTVALTTGYRSESTTKSKTAYDATNWGHSSSCYTSRDSSDGTFALDCWGGNYAYVYWGFTVPSSATDVSYGVPGTVGCCDGGRISKTGERKDTTHYRVTLRATGYRAYTADRVWISYSYKVRI